MYPAKNGVRSAASYFARGDDRPVDLLPDHCFSHTLVRLGVVRAQPNASSAWRARPLWTILGDYGLSSGIVRWPLTYPAQPITGFLVTDRFHQLVGSMIEADERAVYPADILAAARDAFAGSAGASQWDEFYSRAARDVMAQHPVQLEAVRYQGLDIAGHYYLRYAQPRAFGDVSDEERQQYGAVLDRAYASIDGEIGAAIGAASRRAISCSSSRASACSRSARSSTWPRACFAIPTSAAPTRTPRTASCWRTGRRSPPAGSSAAPSSTSRRRSCIFLACRSAATWTATRAPTSSRAFTAERPITFIPSHGR